MLKKIMLLAFTGIAACTPLAERLALTPMPSTLELRPLVSSAMVRTVSLPTYAAVEEIAVETPSGLIVIQEDVLWADAPERAVTLVLTRTLADILNTDVGPEPWPFIGLPDVSIDVRVEEMLAGADGTFRLTGQFFVGGDKISFPNTTHTFNISEGMTDQGYASIAAAQSAALLTLSEQIARTLAR